MTYKTKVIKAATIAFAVIFCTFSGCERKEKGEEELLLTPQAEEGVFSEERPDGKRENDAFETEGTKEESDSRKASEEAESGGGNPAVTDAGLESGGNLAGAGRDSESGGEAKENPRAVHVCGAVKSPGVYFMEPDARVYQAVEKAGGFEPEADKDYLNLADALFDGMKIYVPTRAEVEAGGEIRWKEPGSSGRETPEKSGSKEQGGSFLININTADEAELCTLPGVGSSKAKSIIAYREKNGAYRKIEDIMNVEGIKDGVFQKIKDSITV